MIDDMTRAFVRRRATNKLMLSLDMNDPIQFVLYRHLLYTEWGR